MQKKIKNKKLHPSCFSLSPKLLQLGAGAACGFTLEFCPDIKNKEGGKNLLDLQVYSDYKVHESLSLDFLLLQLAVLFWGDFVVCTCMCVPLPPRRIWKQSRSSWQELLRDLWNITGRALCLPGSNEPDAHLFPNNPQIKDLKVFDVKMLMFRLQKCHFS